MKPTAASVLSVALVLLATGCPQKSKPTDLRLNNGLRVTLRPVDGSPNAAVVVVFDVGGDHDPPGKSGMGHLVEHLYVTAAAGDTKARTAESVMRSYPGFNAQTGGDYTVIATVVSPEKLTAELRDAAARMGDLHIADSDLSRERGRLKAELGNMYQNFPPLAVVNVPAQKVDPPPADGRHGGIPEQVDAITLEEIRQRWQKLYKPRNARLIVVGDFDPAQVKVTIESAFRSIPSGSTPGDVPDSPDPEPGTLTHIDGSSGQRLVGVTWPAVDPASPDYAAFLLLAVRLLRETQTKDGGRVVNAVRYTPLDRPGIISMTLPMQPGETPDEALSRLDEQVAAIVAREPSQADRASAMQFAHMLGVGGYPKPMLRANPYGVAFSTARVEQLGIDTNELGSALKAVDNQKLQAVAQRVFKPENHAAGWTGPEGGGS